MNTEHTMPTPDLERIEALFHKARLLAAGARASYLDDACGDDLELRREVETLLSHADRATSAVDLRAAAQVADAPIVDRGAPTEGPGTRIGPYKILEQIGEGGFGVVYMAEQQEPVQRKVALKIIKLGMDTKQVIARFEAERQALAMMDHPGIARVLDAGATETGRPYFVMELVKGIPVSDFCDSRTLTPYERLQLFIDICHGVQHAHQKGVIHRDIKPSNVLVTLHDDRPVPKIIDFGIAKATAHRLTEKTLFTEFRQFVGTPEYMSPDQAEISGLDIDTRADIYSLGVLLYELLTGTTPFDHETLRGAGYAEMQRIIREVDPPMPSTRIGTLERSSGPSPASPTSPAAAASPAAAPPDTEGPTRVMLREDRPAAAPPAPASGAGTGTGTAKRASSIDRIAHQRHTEPAGLRRLLRGDLDRIVMKAMEKDRSRRYQTASEFAADVQRFLDDEPVLAGSPSAWYRMRKFARRHRVGVGAAAVVTAAVLIGATLAAAGFVRASREAQRTARANEFLQSLILETGEDAGPSVEEIMRDGRALYGDDHAVIGTLLTSRASSLASGGRTDEAVAAQREAVGSFQRAYDGDHGSVASSLGVLGDLLEQQQDLPAAEAAYRDALAMRRRLHGDEHRLTADALEALTSLLVQSGVQSRNDEVRELWAETVRAYEASLGPDDLRTVRQLCQYALWLSNQGLIDEAAALLPAAVERGRRLLGPKDLTLFLTMNAWAQYLVLQTGDLPAATEVVEEMIGIADGIWGREHYASVSLRAQCVALAKHAGDEETAVRLLFEFVEDRRRSGPLRTIAALGSEQQAYVAMREWLDARPDTGREIRLFMVEDAESVLATDSEQIMQLLENTAEWLLEHDFDADAEPMLARLVAYFRGAPATDPLQPALALIMLGDTLMRLDRPAEAEPLLRESLEQRRTDLGPDDWAVPSAMASVGRCLAAQGKFDEAEPLLVEAHESIRANLLAPRARREEINGWVIELYEDWGRPDDAARFRPPDAATNS